MQIPKLQLQKIIKEELGDIMGSRYNEPQSQSQIIIDRTVSTLIESTYDFDPPQENLDRIEAKVRSLLSDPELVSMLDEITR